MASSDDRRPSPTDNKASIALLRRVRAGDHVPFVHHVDVCSAPPEVLVADLDPVPGTGSLDDGGYGRIWYLYHAKKYKNSRGDTSGRRQRAITGGGGTSWHKEKACTDVEGSGGGNFCTFSYGLKTEPSAPLDRMGWCMVEYDTVAADKRQDEATAAAASSSNYVLCKVYRSPRAKGKPASASASSSSKKQKAKKRKAGGVEHPEAPPSKSKSIQQQEQELAQQQETAYCYHQQPQGVAVESEHGVGGDFNFNIEDINFYVSVLRDEPPEPGVVPGLLQHPIAAPEHDGRFIQPPCGPVLAAEACTVGDTLGPETAVQRQGGADSEFTVEWLLRGHEPQQPIVEPPPPPGHGGEFIQMPFGPVVPVVTEATVEDMHMLGLGPPETTYGDWTGGMTTAASTPWSSYDAPTSSSYTPCSGLLQGQDPLLQRPYLMC